MTTCKNNYCPLKYNCQRYTDHPNRFKSHSTFYFDENEDCNSFIAIDENDEINEKE